MDMKKVIGAKKEEIENGNVIRFTPANKKFIFCMPGKECEYKCSGVCPVKEGLNKECKCIELLYEFQASFFEQYGNFPEVLFDEKKQCYFANDGQHRLCIAYQLNMDIMIKKNIGQGDVCEDSNSLKIPF